MGKLYDVFYAGATGGKAFDANSNWEITKFFAHSQNYGKTAGGAFIALLGVILVLYGAFKLFRAITSPQGRAGGEWFKAALALIFGGILGVGGWHIMAEMAGGGSNTVSSLGAGALVYFHPVLTVVTKGLL